MRYEPRVSSLAMKGTPEFVIGDIESMFTNLPRSDVLEWLETQPDSVKGDVLQTLSETNFQYEGKDFDITEELLMDHCMSPPISRGVVTWKEPNLVGISYAVETTISRYVDDIKISGQSSNDTGVDFMKEEYIRR